MFSSSTCPPIKKAAAAPTAAIARRAVLMSRTAGVQAETGGTLSAARPGARVQWVVLWRSELKFCFPGCWMGQRLVFSRANIYFDKTIPLLILNPLLILLVLIYHFVLVVKAATASSL